jgi:hypothetical protein
MYTHEPHMLIDVSLLRRAKVENLERLAKSMGVDVPKRRRDGAYATQLVSALATKIRRDAMMDELRKLTGLGLSSVGLRRQEAEARAELTPTKRVSTRREARL